MNKAYIALGSNLAEREQYLRDAVSLLDENGAVQVEEKSGVYETVPVGYTDQGDFLNMVIVVKTSLPPEELLKVCQSIEDGLGRKRLVKWGPRTIDLDILLYNEENRKAADLTIPHPHMHERAFVIVPLADVDPRAYLPHLQKQAVELLHELPDAERDSVVLWGYL
ncbi:2-amino-4-hydroxy-6-hydroxymethyldihydropteridine diphosphokinase [Halobacillus litoralis]|uniref:2-amino-4-hydroxy-6-hydroxymethyldihydropteridine diphosphokinase n=1 Tax=Halobacillus litoralis TaxID=45668 RepID=A0A845E8L7_9BACI|nr:MULTISPECIES: 2-amino-4-hydroxy-6-hydroxymethyldihydropteridine diphosphokinase [Halobacillus]MYL21994.1 2-amino-4-hydroxy-6-hydroxymethyldihydropteridine diphosphokinase [Halobacillus litoralis]MYL31981.1 2-amino-4-hydroxy-6-hydroxymethyldihydropteridine diphosphokinase [Halobacillus halophilus]MYL39794.1 2-amino-4-hydroxy-6-hydroxymethyldihydropteridine diphosphokinase [Halobacillus litoralis]